MLNKPRSKTIKALTLCELYVIEKQDLEKVLINFPIFKDHMMETAKVR